MIEIGDYNEMLVHELVDHGAYLIAKDFDQDQEVEDEDKVLIPNAYLAEGTKKGDELKVFVYLDSEDRIIATNLEPKIKVKEFAYLEVKQVNQVGAFMDMGLAKDLLVPFRQQANPLQEGKSYVVYMYLDETTNRLIGTTKINQHLNNDFIKLLEGEQVDIMVLNKSQLGYNVIVEGKHKGLVFYSDVFQSLQQGQELKGYIKQIRPDGKMDILLQQQGVSAFEPNAQQILEHIQNNGGSMDITDKSDPDTIYSVFRMSKKSFKRALGTLYKKRLVTIEPGIVKLVQ